MRKHLKTCLGWIGIGSALLVPASAELRLEVDPEDLVLQPETDGQTLVVWLRNTGPETVPVLGGTVHIQIVDGDPSQAAPRLGGLRFAETEETLFRSDNATLTRVEKGPRMWSALIITQPESMPVEVWIPPFSRTALVTVGIDATGVPNRPGGWRLRLADTSEGGSVLDRIDPEDRAVILPIPLRVEEGPLGFQPPSVVPNPTVRSLPGGTLEIQVPIPSSGSVFLESCRDLMEGDWRKVDRVAERAATGWRWTVPADIDAAPAFFRVVTSEPGPAPRTDFPTSPPTSPP